MCVRIFPCFTTSVLSKPSSHSIAFIMRFVSLSQIVYLGLLVCPALGEHILAPAPTDAGVDPVVTEAPGYPALVKDLDTRQLGGDFVAWWEDNSSC